MSFAQPSLLDMRHRPNVKGREEHSFSPGAGGKHAINKTAVIYGANASGKSNFLLGMSALKYLVTQSASLGPENTLQAYDPFRLDPRHADEPVAMEIEFMARDGILYRYELSFFRDGIHSESLYFYPSGSRARLFERRAGQFTYGEHYRGAKKIVEKLLLPQQLFLSKAAENNVDFLMPAYRFFSDGLSVPLSLERSERPLNKIYARRLAEEEGDFFERFNALIRALDTGIDQVVAQEVDWDKDPLPGNLPDELKRKIREGNKYDIKTRHRVYQDGQEEGHVFFEEHMESRGTRSLFVLAGIILDSLEDGKVLVVDEFEKNLHPEVSNYLVQLFHNPAINRKKAQLIFATHDPTLLTNEHFNRDQVWFVEKDQHGGSQLFSIADIKGIRKETPLDKWYLSGRLGGTPLIDDVDFQLAMERDVEE